MKYSTVYVGMDVHKDSFSLCCYTNEKEKAEFPQKVDGHYSKVINYIEAMRFHYGDDAAFICGYEQHSYAVMRPDASGSLYIVSWRIIT